MLLPGIQGISALTSCYVTVLQALDYNAGLTGALAGLAIFAADGSLAACGGGAVPGARHLPY